MRPLVLLLALLLCLDCSATLDAEGRALLRFRERIELDPFGALAGWGGEKGPCSWFGVGCSGDGRVVSLNLKDLYLEGTLAPELGKLTHLKSLILRNNSFYGIIPQEFGELQKLVKLDLGYNNLSDPLPAGLSNILSMGILVLRNNRFIGTVSQEFHERNTLSGFQTDRNHLSSDRGSVKRSDGIATLRKLLLLGNRDGSRVHRNGKIRANSPVSSAPAPAPSHVEQHMTPLSPFNPPGISPSPTLSLPVSLPPSKSVPFLSSVPSPSPISEPPFLIPEIPDFDSYFDSARPSTSVPFVPSSKSHPEVATGFEVKHPKHLWKIIGSIAGVSIILALIIGFLLCFRANKAVTVRPWATGLSGQLQKAFVKGVPALKRSELEIACEDFSNVIGSLPDCMLYKGTLSTGVEIAVLSSLITSGKDYSKQSEIQFRKKISTLSKVNHKNFVNLLGFCEESEPFTRMMVFEYAPNGTLFEHLHIKEAEPLDWAARLRAAMGIAYCLEYMHQLNPPVLLRNLDSSSIYLTDDYAAKISDLGCWNTAKQAEPVYGSPGPLDTPASQTESIVYKFGIILLELLSGRLPFSPEGGLLEQWASCYLTGERPIKEMVDPSLDSMREEETSALTAVIRSCINPYPEERPTMVEIARQLRDITAIAPEGATPKLSPLWWAELEILSSQIN